MFVRAPGELCVDDVRPFPSGVQFAAACLTEDQVALGEAPELHVLVVVPGDYGLLVCGPNGRWLAYFLPCFKFKDQPFGVCGGVIMDDSSAGEQVLNRDDRLHSIRQTERGFPGGCFGSGPVGP